MPDLMHSAVVMVRMNMVMNVSLFVGSIMNMAVLMDMIMVMVMCMFAVMVMCVFMHMIMHIFRFFCSVHLDGNLHPLDSALCNLLTGNSHSRNFQSVQFTEKLFLIGQQFQKRRCQHVPGSSHTAI